MRAPTVEQLNDEKSYKWRYYNVATAASVTGFVRAYLFRALSHSGGLIYCDTDSLAARDLGSLDYGDGLGQWKREGDFDSYAVAGKKLYAFHRAGSDSRYDPKAEEQDKTWKIASKGVNFASREDGPALIQRIAEGDSVEYEPEVPTYSVTREQPRFINRSILKTYKDIAIAPESDL